MFKDYYTILEVGENATQDEIKSAFKKQAIKWHPDKNPGIDTTVRMQEINEAYLILKDPEARVHYDKEYQRFKQHQREKSYQQQSQYEQKEKEKSHEYADYNVEDDILKRWMDNAKRQAVDLAKQTIEDLKGMVKEGAKATVKEAGNQFIYQIIIGVAVLIIFGLIKACNSNQEKHSNSTTTTNPDTSKSTEIPNDTSTKTNTYTKIVNPIQKERTQLDIKKFKQEGFQVFEDDNFLIKCNCKLKPNTLAIKMSKEHGIKYPFSPYLGAENKDSYDIGIIYNINVTDISSEYNSIPQSKYNYFTNQYLKNYIDQLVSNNMSYTEGEFNGVKAVEYSFSQAGLPTKAIIFIKDKKSYLLQVATRNRLPKIFNSLKTSFKFLN